jgi:predicted CoA-binding protein
MNVIKKTLVIGASVKPERYSNKAIRLLRIHGYPVKAIGLRPGTVSDVDIEIGFPEYENIHTVTMYLGESRQTVYYDYLLRLKPERIIFNPGTENYILMEMAQKNGIEVVENCTLVMLNSGLF